MLNKLDILSGLPEVRLCGGLPARRPPGRPLAAHGGRAGAGGAGLRGVPRLDGRPRRRRDRWPTCRPRRRPSWRPSSGVPACPITLVSVGPERTQTIIRSAERRPRDGPAGGGRVTTASPRRILIAGRWRPRARAGLAAGGRPGRRARDRGARQPGHGGRSHRRPGLVPGVDPADVGGGRAPGPTSCGPTWSSSAPRRPWWRASPTPSARPASTALGPGAAGGAAGGQQGRSAARSPRAAGRARWPTGAAFEAVAPAMAFAAGLEWQVVVKADGLAAGKGVTVCDDEATVAAALREALEDGRFGAAGSRVVVEERLVGREASVIALCDETAVLALPAARDHKRLGGWRRRPQHRRHGRVLAACRPGRATAVERILETVHAPVLAEAAPARDPLPRRAVRRPDAHRWTARACSSSTSASATRRRRPSCRGWPCRSRRSWRPPQRDAWRGVAAGSGLAPRASLPAARRGAAWRWCWRRLAIPERPRRGDPIAGLADARTAGGLVFTAGVERGGRWPAAPPAGASLTVVGRGRDLAAAADAAYARQAT